MMRPVSRYVGFRTGGVTSASGSATHKKWWPKCENPSVWGRFAGQACCGRHLFSGRDQPCRYFAETLVARQYEKRGYVCWTLVRVLRKPGRVARGMYGAQTRLVEARLSESTGIVPQLIYEKEYAKGLRLKNPDLVGFHFGLNHWIFAEVKRTRDRMHPQQEAGLLFLREVLPTKHIEVFVADVQER